jgi:ABC-type transporter Mla maintaining outer membrane lipid asymmetry ATPase subunit MlaF
VAVIFSTTARIPVGASATALLDAHSVSFGDGAISLHSEAGIPLRNLGTGSSRLLIAGLHRAAAALASIVPVDEIEYGLEPHRLTRLLNSLGSKEKSLPLQAFITTHSPVTLRELAGSQLFVLRNEAVCIRRDRSAATTTSREPFASIQKLFLLGLSSCVRAQARLA